VAKAPCTAVPTPNERGIVVFDAAEFVAAYPAFATLTNAQMGAAFAVATIFLNNSCCSIVEDVNVRQVLLYMLTAHVCALVYGENGNAPSGIVGRVNTAREGSVSVGAEYAADMSMSEAYFSQTPYGAMFWQVTTPFRMGGYITPGPSNECVGRFPGYGPGMPFPPGGGSGCC